MHCCVDCAAPARVVLGRTRFGLRRLLMLLGELLLPAGGFSPTRVCGILDPFSAGLGGVGHLGGGQQGPVVPRFGLCRFLHRALFLACTESPCPPHTPSMPRWLMRHEDSCGVCVRCKPPVHAPPAVNTRLWSPPLRRTLKGIQRSDWRAVPEAAAPSLPSKIYAQLCV